MDTEVALKNGQNGSKAFLKNKKFFINDKIGFVENMEVFGNDLTVVNAARVSFNKESEFELIRDESGKTVDSKLSSCDCKLINYLAKHKHDSPFFHPILRFRIKMPIFVVREWYRHVIGFARNEVSRRYVTFTPELFVPCHLRKKDENVKQGSSEVIVENNDFLVSQMKSYCQKALSYYEELLKMNVCPEQARMILPQSMYTEFVETASLAAYARLAKLRMTKTAQKEIQVYAGMISKHVKTFFPVSWKALLEN